MPKQDKVPIHRNSSISAASAAGGGTRNSSWSAGDDKILIQARTQGLNWNQISPKHFPSKSANACRKRHERLMERQNAEQWDGVKLDVLAQAYMDARREMWSILANRVGEKWTVVEQKCMEKGLKNLNQAFRSAQKKGANDSGISISDQDEDDRTVELAFPHHQSFPYVPRVSSIQSILQPTSMGYHSHSHYQQQQQPPPPPPQQQQQQQQQHP
ncbi:hypothetical protein P280DRAFT_252236 [Massarina eburnea CBS 473.64]|uniref:Myb-like domain-containing protein n=1 Tax=Massarina eburnea CBS 473.64 TaxID=1395130 RepID=A0A6A6S9J8_9PLEO|nr:hypothetical protein P280DRAFT_252236 [Massarina eburnea CBS 473.64]